MLVQDGVKYWDFQNDVLVAPEDEALFDEAVAVFVGFGCYAAVTSSCVGGDEKRLRSALRQNDAVWQYWAGGGGASSELPDDRTTNLMIMPPNSKEAAERLIEFLKQTRRQLRILRMRPVRTLDLIAKIQHERNEMWHTKTLRDDFLCAVFAARWCATTDGQVIPVLWSHETLLEFSLIRLVLLHHDTSYNQYKDVFVDDGVRADEPEAGDLDALLDQGMALVYKHLELSFSADKIKLRSELRRVMLKITITKSLTTGEFPTSINDVRWRELLEFARQYDARRWHNRWNILPSLRVA